MSERLDYARRRARVQERILAHVVEVRRMKLGSVASVLRWAQRLAAARVAVLSLVLLGLVCAPVGAELIAQRIVLQPITTSGTDCTVATNCVSIADVFRSTGVSFQLAGTWTGTAQFEGTVDGTNWVALLVTPLGTTTAVTSATANGAWSVATVALQGVRVRASALASPTISVSIIAR